MAADVYLDYTDIKFFFPSHIKLILIIRMRHQTIQINRTFYTEMKKRHHHVRTRKEKMGDFTSSLMQVLVLLKYFYYY